MSYVVQYNVHLFKFPFWKVSYFRKFFMEIDPKLEVVDIKEENVRIYRRYIVYRETLTRYFVEKNRRGEKSLKIDKKSSIYPHQAINRRFNEKKTTKKEENHRNIGNFSFGQHVAVLCYSALSKMPLFCAVEGI